MVYGFDCAHAGDWSETHPYGKKWTLEEVEKETENMAVAIQLAAKYEKRYLQALTNKGKAKIIDEYHKELKQKHGIVFNLNDNFGAMLNVLGGVL
jgi:hypothetical protein